MNLVKVRTRYYHMPYYFRITFKHIISVKILIFDSTKRRKCIFQEMHIASNRETLFVLTLLTYRMNWMRCLVKIFSFNWLIFAKSLHVCLWTDFEETLYVCVWPTLYVGTVVNLTSKCNNSKNFDAWVLGSFEPNGRTKVNFFTTFLSIPALSFHLLLLSL